MKSQNQKEEEKIRQIEKEIDNLFLSYDFMSLPHSIAIQYILIFYENFFRIQSGLVGINSFNQKFQHDALIESTKYSLMHSINWVSRIKINSSEKFLNGINEKVYLSTKDFFEMALSYHGAVSAYTMWSRGFSEAKAINDNTVFFEYLGDEVRYDMLDEKLNIERRENLLDENIEKIASKYFKPRRLVEKSVKQTGEYTISYSTKEVKHDEIMSISFLLMKEQTIPPDIWCFKNIPTDYFKKFWSAIMSISMLHKSAIDFSAEKFNFKHNIIISSVVIRAKTDWIRQISRWTGLTKKIVEEILEYHTYSKNHKKPDIVLTPFIHITNKHLALAPTLIMTNNLGRNLLKHLAKNYKNEFDKSSAVFEDQMISKFENSMRGKFFEIIPKRRITKADKKLPDIDICLVDKEKKHLMVCEFKWTIPAAEPSEILEKMEIEKKALKQLKLIKEYLQNNIKVSQVFNLKKDIQIKESFFIIVLENCFGTDYMFNEEFPTVEYNLFCDFLNKKRSLEEVFNEIRDRSFLPMKGTDFELKDVENKIGKFKVIWTGFIVV